MKTLLANEEDGWCPILLTTLPGRYKLHRAFTLRSTCPLTTNVIWS